VEPVRIARDAAMLQPWHPECAGLQGFASQKAGGRDSANSV
jgi:hypothetical protein